MTATTMGGQTPALAGFRRDAWVAAGVALALATALVLLLPPGSDLAAHEYQLSLFAQHGWTLWDNFWYGGRYTFVTYSVLYYPLAALVGIKLLALVGVAVAAAAFTLLTAREWGRDAIWASRVFAVVWAGFVVTAAFPFALGVALGAVALVAVQRGSRRHFAGLSLLTLLASPLAFALLSIVSAGVFFARRRHLAGDAALVLPLAALGLSEVVLWRLFPDPGRYPFPLSQFAAAATFCLLGVAATWGVDRARPLMCIFVAYLIACSLAFALPSAVGENIARLRFMALPVAVLALSLRHWRPRAPAMALLVLAALWNLTPLGWTVDRSAGDSARTAAYWAGTATFLQTRLTSNHRVEVVDTASHWASYYLARRQLCSLAVDVPPGRLPAECRAVRQPHGAGVPALAPQPRSSVRGPPRCGARLQRAGGSEAPAKCGRPSSAGREAQARHRLRGAAPAPDRGRSIPCGGESADHEDDPAHARGAWSLQSRRPVLAVLASQPGMHQSHRGRRDGVVGTRRGAGESLIRRRPAPDARNARPLQPRMPLSDLIRQVRERALAVAALVVVPIAAGLTVALIVNAATDSGRYGLWVGSAVTVATTSIVLRHRR